MFDVDTSVHIPRHPRPETIGTDDDGGVLDRFVPCGIDRSNADDPVAVANEFLDHHAFANVRAGLARRRDQEVIQDATTRTVHGIRPIHGIRRAADDDRSEIHRDGVDQRAAGSCEPGEQAPCGEHRCCPRRHEVGRHRIAGKSCPVEGEDATALARQQHRHRRASAARAHHDGIRMCHVGRPPWVGYFGFRGSSDGFTFLKSIGPMPCSRITTSPLV